MHDFVSGYFIINGMEKNVQAQIKLRANSIHVFKLSTIFLTTAGKSEIMKPVLGGFKRARRIMNMNFQ